jgi:hypothetical protein
MRLRFDAKSYVIEPVYRDDNLFLWDSDAPPEETRSELDAQAQPNEQDETVPRTDDNATQELRVRTLPIAKTAEEAPPSAYTTVARYDEWDDRIGLYRRQWCTLIEEIPQQADSSHLTAMLAAQLKQSTRLAQLLQARKQGQRQRPIRHTEGDDLELDAMVKAQIDLRSISNANFSFPSVMLVMFYFHSGDSHILASFPAPSEGLIDPYIRAQVAFLHVPVSGLCNRIYWGLHYLSRTLSRLFLLLGRTGLFQQCRALSRRGSSGRRPIRPWQFFQSPE